MTQAEAESTASGTLPAFILGPLSTPETLTLLGQVGETACDVDAVVDAPTSGPTLPPTAAAASTSPPTSMFGSTSTYDIVLVGIINYDQCVTQLQTLFSMSPPEAQAIVDSPLPTVVMSGVSVPEVLSILGQVGETACDLDSTTTP